MNDDRVKLTVAFERKQGLPNYSSATGKAWVEVEIDSTAPAEVISKELGEAFSLAKASVLDELGIEVELSESGVLREKNVPIAHVETGGAGGAGGLRDNLGATGGWNMRGLEVANADDMTEDIPAWLPPVCEEAGVTKVWANHGKFGTFYKEFVSKESEPKMGTDDQGRTIIIKQPR